ncbi:protein FAM200B-like [Penaeus monodon]|uniref:protein FAM200B-like n=1 Tax=Penaeus monodon TaxID=6687 RepID=UPI0018A73D71|nr:protein FAM200B-like [Penaeus monodon]
MDRFVIKRVSVQSSSTCAPDKNTQANEPGSIIREAASTSASEPAPKKKVKSWTRQYSDEFLKYGFVKHLETKHPSLATKPVDYFQRRKEQMKMSVKVLNTATTLNDKAQLASYLVSCRIAKEKVPYTCGEKLILPSYVDIVSTMLDGNWCDTYRLLENLLFSWTKDLRYTGVLNDCIVGKYKLNGPMQRNYNRWSSKYDWKKSGVVTKLSEAAVMMYPRNLRGVLNDVKVINTIKGSALNSRLFELLCLEMGADHSHLLYHTEVRWLSRGRILTRVYELRMEIHIFLLEKKSTAPPFFVKQFEQYFPEENLKNIRDNHWVKDPFAFEKPEAVIGLNLTPDEENELHLTSDTSLRIKMQSSPLSSFWISVSKEYPHLTTLSQSLRVVGCWTSGCDLQRRSRQYRAKWFVLQQT